MNTPMICPRCKQPMNYHQWPCIDEGTGEHLGDWALWRCEECDVTLDGGTPTIEAVDQCLRSAGLDPPKIGAECEALVKRLLDGDA